MEPVQGEATRSPEEFARRVEAALAKVRPALQADGGDIELIAVEGSDARVRLKGACHG
jgi:Fe-S cluster biogenesis protein NfuA